MLSRDSKRIQGPSSTKPISTFLRDDSWQGEERSRGLCDDNGRRVDGRKLDECLPIYLETGVVTKAKGSSYFEKNGAKVMCAVYGPRESQRKTEFSSQGKLLCDVSFASFSQRERYLEEPRAKNISSLVETALKCAVCLDSFPKSQVEVYIKVLQDSGCILAPAIICASLALADAGIETYDLVTACSLVFDNSHIALDPLISEISESNKRGVLTIAYLPSLNEISCVVQDGVSNSERSIACINQCINGCIRIHSVMKDCLIEGAKRKEEIVKQESTFE